MNTIFVSAGIARRDHGAIITADAVQCETADAGINHAKRLSRSPGYLGAWAFTATGTPTYGYRSMKC